MSSPIPGMPEGKPAGMRCIQLTADLRCALYGLPGRPEVCIHLEPSIEMCGENAEQAMAGLAALEAATDPGGGIARTIPGHESGDPALPDPDGRARAGRKPDVPASEDT